MWLKELTRKESGTRHGAYKVVADGLDLDGTIYLSGMPRKRKPATSKYKKGRAKANKKARRQRKRLCKKN